MAMNGKLPDFDLPVWFDGKSINEALFCEEYLQRIKSFMQMEHFSHQKGV